MMHTDLGGHEKFKLGFGSKIFGQINMSCQDWTLMIKFVTARDSGAYECQVISSAFILILITIDK